MKDVSQFLTEIVAITSVLIITSVMGFIASAMLINAAGTEDKSESWDTIARGVATVNIILFGTLLGFGIYIMWHAIRTEKSQRAAAESKSSSTLTTEPPQSSWKQLFVGNNRSSDPFFTQLLIDIVLGH